jgi:hypothetical protein
MIEMHITRSPPPPPPPPPPNIVTSQIPCENSALNSLYTNSPPTSAVHPLHRQTPPVSFSRESPVPYRSGNLPVNSSRIRHMSLLQRAELFKTVLPLGIRHLPLHQSDDPHLISNFCSEQLDYVHQEYLPNLWCPAPLITLTIREGIVDWLR